MHINFVVNTGDKKTCLEHLKHPIIFSAKAWLGKLQIFKVDYCQQLVVGPLSPALPSTIPFIISSWKGVHLKVWRRGASERVFNAVTLSGCHQHLIISISNGGNTLTIIFSVFLEFNSFLGSSGLVCFYFTCFCIQNNFTLKCLLQVLFHVLSMKVNHQLLHIEEMV